MIMFEGHRNRKGMWARVPSLPGDICKLFLKSFKKGGGSSSLYHIRIYSTLVLKLVFIVASDIPRYPRIAET